MINRTLVVDDPNLSDADQHEIIERIYEYHDSISASLQKAFQGATASEVNSSSQKYIENLARLLPENRKRFETSVREFLGSRNVDFKYLRFNPTPLYVLKNGCAAPSSPASPTPPEPSGSKI